MQNSLLLCEFFSFSMSVSLFGILILFYSSVVPETVQRVFRYGKFTANKSSAPFARAFEIPKRWFFHFYVFAAIFYSILSAVVFGVYFARTEVPHALRTILNVFVGTQRTVSVSRESVIIALLLMMVQVTRRLFECTLLSVYSDGRMNVIHYFCGFSFYFGVGLSLVAEAPEFSGKRIATNDSAFLVWNHVTGIVIFLLASYAQFKCHVILARLRKDSRGRVVTYAHRIPRGDLFELISCPHYFAEILIYVSILLVFNGTSVTWWMVNCFVMTNQVIVGVFNHRWYIDTFQNYPKTRKAVIPFIL